MVFWPRTIQLSYGQQNCVTNPVPFPSIVKYHSDSFKIYASNTILLSGLPILAHDTCIVPTVAPSVGTHYADLSLLGLPLLRIPIIVKVPTPPVLSTQGFRDDISTTDELIIELSDSDDIFQYVAKFDDRDVLCDMHGSQLICDVESLKLNEGRTYQFSLDRYYGDNIESNVISQEITTMRSARVLKTSINDGKTIYSKPKGISLWLDKEIVNASARLKRVKGGTADVPVVVKVDDKKIHVSWDKVLDRRTKYEFVLSDVVAKDGSGMKSGFSLGFYTSGGPKVTGINVGSYGVPKNFTATISFDQKILESQDIMEHVSVTGGAKIAGVSSKNIYISFAGVNPCRSIKISVGDSLKSLYGITGGSSWTYTTRTVCHTVTTIGASVQGRAINAYWFGSGTRTIVFTGAIHGDESSTYSLMHQWINALEAGYHLIPSNIRVVVVPAINPDGVASGTRYNARGVDLNRNFDTSDWKKNISNIYGQPFPGGGGKARLSEPESVAIAGLVSQLKPAIVLSYHSIGSVVLANPVAISSHYAHTYATYSGYQYSSSSEDTFDYGITGTADDYYWERLGVASIVVELGSHTYHQFPQNQEAMWKMLK